MGNEMIIFKFTFMICTILLKLSNMTPSPASSAPGIGIGQNHITFRVTKDGIITFVDKNVQELLNKATREVLGEHIWTLAHPLDERLIRDAIKASIETQQHRVKLFLKYKTKIIILGGYVQISQNQSKCRTSE